MTARAIVSGSLVRPPAKKATSRGATYLIASIRETHGGASRYWSAFVFDEDAIDAIERLQPGEPIAVTGEIEAAIFRPDGKEPRVSFSVKVDGVLSARRPSRQKRGDAPKPDQPARQSRQREFDDAIPF